MALKWISLLRLLFSIYWEAESFNTVRRLFDGSTSKSLSSSADDVGMQFKLYSNWSVVSLLEKRWVARSLLEPSCKLPRSIECYSIVSNSGGFMRRCHSKRLKASVAFCLRRRSSVITWKEQWILCCYLSADEVFVLIRSGSRVSGRWRCFFVLQGITKARTEIIVTWHLARVAAVKASWSTHITISNRILSMILSLAKWMHNTWAKD